MFKSLYIITITVLFISGASFASNSEVKTLINKFADADNNQNSKQFEILLADQFTFVMPNTKNEITTPIFIIKKDFIASILDKKFGGGDKKLSIKNIEVSGNIAKSHIVLENSKIKFDHHLHMIKKGSQWKICQAMTSMVFK